MDHQRFDRLSRSLATRTTRRQAVRQVGAGGVLGGVAAVFGVKSLQAGAQGAVQTCALPVYAEVYVGPWLGQFYEGTLALDMDADGAIDSGSFDLLDGTSYPLVGQATGRGIDLRVDLGNEQLLTLTGTAQADFALCQGEAAGSFGGPEMGNMGTWITTGPGQLTPVGSGDPGITPTVPPDSCAAVSCMVPMAPNPETCVCECQEPYPACGDVCCGVGAVCTDPTTGTCACPAGTQECGDGCVPECGEGELIDSESCVCGSICPGVDCTPAQTLNLETCECEELELCLGGQVACGVDCVDLNSDPAHCGSCDHVCPSMPNSDGVSVPSLCVAGDCCLDLDQQCVADVDCCSGSCNFILGGLQVCT